MFLCFFVNFLSLPWGSSLREHLDMHVAVLGLSWRQRGHPSWRLAEGRLTCLECSRFFSQRRAPPPKCACGGTPPLICMEKATSSNWPSLFPSPPHWLLAVPRPTPGLPSVPRSTCPRVAPNQRGCPHHPPSSPSLTQLPQPLSHCPWTNASTHNGGSLEDRRFVTFTRKRPFASRLLTEHLGGLLVLQICF